MTKPTIIITITKGSVTFDADRRLSVSISGKTQVFETTNYIMHSGSVKVAKVLLGGHTHQVDLEGPNSAGNTWKVK